MKFIKVKIAGENNGCSYIDYFENMDFKSLFEDVGIGEGYTITVIDMDKSEFESLTEFDGF